MCETNKIKRALIINTTNNIGSTGKLTFNLYNYLNSQGIVAGIIAGKGVEDKKSNQFCISNKMLMKVSGLLERLSGLVGLFSFCESFRAYRILKRFNPDCVFLGNLHGGYINIFLLYHYIKTKNLKCVQLMWDEFAFSGKCVYTNDCLKYKDICRNCPCLHFYPTSWFFDCSSILQRIKRRLYDIDHIAFVGAPNTVEKAEHSTLLKLHKLITLDEAVDQEKLFFPRNTEQLRKKYNISEDKIVILDVCVFSNERKGGKYFLELAKRMEDYKDYVFINIGFDGDAKNLPSNFLPIKYVKDQELLSYFYSMSDLYICTSSADTMPNACLEALSCGTPICGFNVSGIPSCAEYPFGKYVELFDVVALQSVVLSTEKKTPLFSKKTREYAQKRFSSSNYNKKLLSVAEQL